jgi:hypothetical protein
MVSPMNSYDLDALRDDADRLRADLAERRERRLAGEEVPTWRVPEPERAVPEYPVSEVPCRAVAPQPRLDRMMRDPTPLRGPSTAYVRRSVEDGEVVGQPSTAPPGAAPPLPPAEITEPLSLDQQVEVMRGQGDVETAMTRRLADLSDLARTAGVPRDTWTAMLLARLKIDARNDPQSRLVAAHILARAAQDLDPQSLADVQQRARWN